MKDGHDERIRVYEYSICVCGVERNNMGMNPDAQHDLMEWCGGDGRGLETQRVREIWGGGG